MAFTSSKKPRWKAAAPSPSRNAEPLDYLFLTPPNTAVVSATPAPQRCARPTVLCFHGSGHHDTHQESWLATVQGVADFAPILYYDRRASIGNNNRATVTETRSLHQTPDDAVQDLRRLLRALDLRPPYLLLAHSYGGTIARTFLQSCRDQVVGMVLAETGQETPTPYDEEQYRRRILGSKPVSVIHAVFVVAEEEDPTLMGVEGGRGRIVAGATTAAQGEERARLRQAWAEEDERLKKAQLRLSSNARYVRVDRCGHNVVRERPDVVIEEVRWVFEEALRGTSAVGGPLGWRRWREGAMRWLSRG